MQSLQTMNNMKALIYCRVSSERQVKEGHGNDSQEKRCRNHAAERKYPVERVFPDEGISGSLFDRPAMKALLKYIDENPHEQYVVIFDDLSRFARDVKVHIQLRAEFTSRGVKLECLNFNFDDSEESEFAELILAVSNQYQRKSNRRQVIQKMKARLEKGYWPFMLPYGLINEKSPIHGKIAISNEPYASIYKEGIENYRDGVLSSILDFQTFVNEKYQEHGIKHRMSFSSATETLKEILYAGYIDYPKWGIPRMKAQHEGFITIETYDIVQERLTGRAKPWHRKDYHLDFPLRPYVLCDGCGVPMSGAYNTGRNGRHPHYYCRGKGCQYIWKTVRKKDFEDKFEALLLQVKPGGDVIDLAKDVFLETWSNRLENYTLLRINAQNELRTVKTEISDYADMARKAKDETLKGIYEDKVKELAETKKLLDKKLGSNKYTEEDFGTASEKVLNTLKKPVDMWKSDDYNDKRTILFMYFEEQLRYNYETGFGTASLAYPVKLISDLGQANNGSVEMWRCDLQSENYFLETSTSVVLLLHVLFKAPKNRIIEK